MQRLALVSACDALEMSGYVPNRTPSSMLDRVGTFYGQTIDDYREVNASQKIDAFYVTGGLRPFGPVSRYADISLDIRMRILTACRVGSITTTNSLALASVSILHVRQVWQRFILPATLCGMENAIPPSQVERISLLALTCTRP